MTKQPPSLKSKALDFLSRRDYSYRELFQKLQKYSADNEEIKRVLDEMVSKKFLNEARYIESFITSKSQKYGSLKINYLLQEKVNDKNLIQEIYAASEIDELATAHKIWQRKFGGHLPTNNQDKARQIRFMLSRGFSMSVILQVFQSVNNDKSASQ